MTQSDDARAENEARERILALPKFTLMRLGWEIEPGRVQGGIFYRFGDGIGPTGRDLTPSSVLQDQVQRVHMPHAHQRWGIEILASPAAGDAVGDSPALAAIRGIVEHFDNAMRMHSENFGTEPPTLWTAAVREWINELRPVLEAGDFSSAVPTPAPDAEETQ